MPTDWRRLSRAAGLQLTTEGLRVPLGDRQQAVLVEEPEGEPAALRIFSFAGPPRVSAGYDPPDLLAWERNRASDIVGFKLDGRGRLIGEAWVPTVGLDAEEWAFYVRTVAEACDRLEYLLTGRDEM